MVTGFERLRASQACPEHREVEQDNCQVLFNINETCHSMLYIFLSLSFQNFSFMEIHFQVLEYGTGLYHKTVELRDAILRKPLGMKFIPEQLAAEKEQIHIASFDNTTMSALACLILANNGSGKIKMRQVAVSEDVQRKGIGQKMVAYAEQYAREQLNGKIMYCHARNTAVPFYLKLNYHIIGEPFEEISIKHFKMEKKL